MNAMLGAVLGLAVWAFLFLILPQEFLGTVVGRPFEMDDGQLIIRYPWGMVVAIVALFVLPVIGAKSFGGKS
jgi:hypothetical protein